MSDKTSDKLLPCPFCGGEGKVSEFHSFWYKSGCSNLNCFAYITSLVFQTKEEAIAAWNTRKPMERIVERLEDNSEWTDSTFDEDGYCNDDSFEVIRLEKAIEIIKEELN